jgi:hypothetical protein
MPTSTIDVDILEKNDSDKQATINFDLHQQVDKPSSKQD